MRDTTATWWHKFTRWWQRPSRASMRSGALEQAADGPWPVHLRVLLSKSEQQLHQRLLQAFPQHLIFSQVALSQLIGLNAGTAWSTRNRYSQLVADFVICDLKYQPLAVIEVDGITHDHPKQAEADSRKVAVLSAAQLVLLRLNGAALPTVEELKRQLSEVIPVPQGPLVPRRWHRGAPRRGS
jgi:very-short-patch-repair endonuclease